MSTKKKKKMNDKEKYENCMKKSLTFGKPFGSDFTDGFVIQNYSKPPYPWRKETLRSDTKKIKTKRQIKKR